MEDFVRQFQWLWPLAVPVVTGVFALGGAWLGGRLGKHNEHTQWRRNERMEAYTDFLTAIKREIGKITYNRDLKDASLEFPHTELDRIEIVGSQRVRVLARKFQDHVHVYRNNASFVFQSGERPHMPVETKNRYVDQFTNAAARLSELQDAYVIAVRQDLGTYARRDNQSSGVHEGVTVRSPAS